MMPCVDATADAGGFDDDGEGEPMSVSGKLSVCVLGAGSLGCVFGGLLGANGHEVVLVNRNRSLVETLNRNGLVLHTNQGDRSIAVTAAQGCSGLGPFAVVLLLVKSFHTREALEAVGDVIGDDTVVVSLQNGLGHEELIGDIVGMERCILGKTYVGGTMTEPGHIVGGAVGKLTYIGELDGKVSERVARIADQFTEAGLETIASDRIMQIVWDKLLVNAATGALSAITRLPYGHLYDVPEVAECGRAAVVPTADEQVTFLYEHFHLMRQQHGEFSCRMFRKFAAWYGARLGIPEDLEDRLRRFESPQEFDSLVNEIRQRHGERSCQVPTALIRTPNGPVEHW